jgi:hypothetical protein
MQMRSQLAGATAGRCGERLRGASAKEVVNDARVDVLYQQISQNTVEMSFGTAPELLS